MFCNIIKDVSNEIDAHHDAYMDFMNQCLESPDLLSKATSGITVEEKHLIYIELMIMEQVEDWEVGVGKTEQESGKRCLDMYLCKMPIYIIKKIQLKIDS